MSMKIEIVGSQELQQKLHQVGQVRLQAWVNYAINDEAHSYIEYVRRSWLSGQALNATPESDVWKSLAVWTRKRDQRTFIRPGVGINGMLNYLARWDKKSGHEFMDPSWMAYGGNEKINKAVMDNIEKMMAKTFKGA